MPLYAPSLDIQELRRVIYSFEPRRRRIEEVSNKFFIHRSSLLTGNHIIQTTGYYQGKELYDVCDDLYHDLISGVDDKKNLALEVLSCTYQIYLMPKAEYTSYVLDRLLKFVKKNPECLRLIYGIRIYDTRFHDESITAPRIEIDISLGKNNAQRLLNILLHAFLPMINQAKCMSHVLPKYSQHVSGILYYSHGVFDLKTNLFRDRGNEDQLFDESMIFVNFNNQDFSLTVSDKLEEASHFSLQTPSSNQIDLVSGDAAITTLLAANKDNDLRKINKDNFLLKYSVVFDDSRTPYALHSKVLGFGVQGRVKLAQNVQTKQWVAVKITILDDSTSFCSHKSWSCERDITAHLGRLRGSTVRKNKNNQQKGYMFLDLYEGGKVFCDMFEAINDSDFKNKLVGAYLDNALGMILALSKIHEKDTVHTDLHEQHFIKQQNGEYIIIDFGLSLKLPPDAEEVIAECENYNRSFLSPEIADFPARATYSISSDIYALGYTFNRYLSILKRMLEDLHVHDHEIWRIVEKIERYIIRKMLHEDRYSRPSLERCIAQINLFQSNLKEITHERIDSENMFMAIIDDDKETVELLLMRAPELILFRDRYDRSAIALARLLKRDEIYQYMIGFRTNVLSTIKDFFQDILKNDIEAVNASLKEHKWLVNIIDGGGYSPLYVACSLGHIELSKILISLGANIHFVTKNRQGLLHAVADSGCVEIAEIFISDYRYNLNALDCLGYSALHRAILARHRNFANFLMARGAVLSVNNELNQNLIYGLPKHKQADLAYQAYVSSNCRDAIIFRDLFFICIGIEATDCISSMVNNNLELKEYLLNSKDCLSLHRAISTNAMKSAKLLLELGADPDIYGKGDKHLVQLALDFDNLDIAELIHEKSKRIPLKTEWNYKKKMLDAGKEYVPLVNDVIREDSADRVISSWYSFRWCR